VRRESGSGPKVGVTEVEGGDSVTLIEAGGAPGIDGWPDGALLDYPDAAVFGKSVHSPAHVGYAA
jgi:hypothetical protein